MIFEIYTDGSWTSNGNTGSFGYLDKTNRFIFISPVYKNTTSQVMEMYAFYAAILHILRLNLESKTIIYTDSNYICNSYNIWLKGWFLFKNGKIIPTSKGSKLVHKYLWIRVFLLKSKSKLNMINVKWVKAHSTNKYNNLVDKLIRLKCMM